MKASGCAITAMEVGAYRVPTESPESDGTLEWNATTLVVVELSAGDIEGLGYSYADVATAHLIDRLFRDLVVGRDVMDVPGVHECLVDAIRNLGRPGICSMAISAVDNALWDLKARVLDLPLVSLLGAVRESVAIYGSGGFTSYSIPRLQEQVRGWIADGIPRVKMKVGRDPDADVKRIRAAREAAGPDAKLFVDANGAYHRKQALSFAERFAPLGVNWLEEPVPSTDLNGLRLIRDRAPAGMDVTAGEYGYQPGYFRGMLEAGAVDVLQADATRCGGITGFMAVCALCEAFEVPLSSHCAPSIHVHVGCAARPLRHIEYFFDHVRIERMLFDGALRPADGRLLPDRSRPGMGLEFKRRDAERYSV